MLGRIDFEQKMINKAPRVINDDVVSKSDRCLDKEWILKSRGLRSTHKQALNSTRSDILRIK